MTNEDYIMNNLQRFINENPENITIIEEQISIELQMSYFKRSKRLKKRKVELQEILDKTPLLYRDDIRLEEKRDLLIHLASFDKVEAFRAIEAYWKVAEGDIKPWASMSYRESKMMLESSLLDEKHILISTGLGGKGRKLRYFMVFIHAQNNDFSDSQKKIVVNEIEEIFRKSESEIESIEFDNQLIKITSLIPLQISVHELVTKAVAECNNFGDFISDNFLITNVKQLENEEIFQIIKQQSEELLLGNIDDLEDFDEYDEDDDEDDDE